MARSAIIHSALIHLPKHVHHNGSFCLLGRGNGRSYIYFLSRWFDNLITKLHVLSAKACKQHVCVHLALPILLRTETRLRHIFYKSTLKRLSSLFFSCHSLPHLSQEARMVGVCICSAASPKSLKMVGMGCALAK